MHQVHLGFLARLAIRASGIRVELQGVNGVKPVPGRELRIPTRRSGDVVRVVGELSSPDPELLDRRILLLVGDQGITVEPHPAASGTDGAKALAFACEVPSEALAAPTTSLGVAAVSDALAEVAHFPGLVMLRPAFWPSPLLAAHAVWTACSRPSRLLGKITLHSLAASWNTLRSSGVSGLNRLLRQASSPSLAPPPPPAPEDALQVVQRLADLGQGPATLILDHAWGGGANIYSRALENRVLDQGGTAWTLAATSGGQALLSLSTKQSRAACRIAGNQAGAVVQELTRRGLAALVVNELVGFPRPLDLLAELGDIAAGSGVALRCHVHDHYPLCPGIFLAGPSGTYCGLPEAQICASCPKSLREEAQGRSISEWRGAWTTFLSRAEEIVFFSEATVRAFRRALPGLAPGSFRVRPHQVAVRPGPSRQPSTEGPYRLLVPGALTPPKGLDLLLDLIHQAHCQNLPLRFILAGYAPGRCLWHPLLEVTGQYAREDLPGILANSRADAVLVPSVVPETFCLTAAEATALGYPLAALAMGAQEERVRENPHGLLLPGPNPGQILAALMPWLAVCRKLTQPSQSDGT